MYQFKRIHIKGFRRLFDVDLEMRPLMVMIGANGIGKSSLLDVFKMLSASAGGNLNTQMSELGGIASLLTKDRAESLSFTLEMSNPLFESLKYELQITPAGSSYDISSETLTQNPQGNDELVKHIESRFNDIQYFDTIRKKSSRPTWDHNPFETSLSQVPKMFNQPEVLRRNLSSAVLYHILNVRHNSPVKLPQQMKPASLPGKDGEDLVSLLYNLRESDADRYEAIIDTLKSAFPGFETLSFPPAAAGVLAMTWKESYFDSPLYMHQLSDGILRFLWLVTLLQSPGLPMITMIDEPEVSLHPELLSLLADLMREASSRTQLIVATQSDRLIRFLDPAEVVVMNRTDDGFADLQWADSLDIEEWLADYTLDELWGMGRLGGRA